MSAPSIKRALEPAADARALPPAQAAGRRPSAQNARQLLLAAGVVITMFVLAYLPVLRTLIEQWSANETYSFGVLVPFISGYLVWSRRSRLRALHVAPSVWAGSAVLAVAVALLLFGRASAIVGLQEISLVLAVAGLVLLVLGRVYFRALLFPVAYLLLMLPVWEIFTDRLHYHSQLFSAALGEFFLQSAGVPVHRVENYLELPNITLEVASICSGVNFLISVIAIGAPQAYLFLAGWLPRFSAMAFAVAVAFLSNGIRVGLIGVLAYYRPGPGPVHGHLLQGLFVSGIGFIAVIGAISFLARRYPRVPEPHTEPELSRSSARGQSLTLAALCALVLLGVAGLVRPQYERLVTAGASGGWSHIQPAGWKATGQQVPPQLISSEGANGTFARVFVSSSGERVEMFAEDLSYIGRGTGVQYRSIELPRNTASSQTLVDVGGDSVKVNRVGLNTSEVMFWYDLDGRITAERTLAKAFGASRLLVGLNPRVRLVVVTASGPAKNDALMAFVRSLLSSPHRYATR